jgi:two-component system phosphate regulon sensor histidine kinase PhoR
MRLKLTRLVLITCMALLGIIMLQVFWLFNAFKEQQERLSSGVELAMIETQILTGVNSSLNETAQELANSLISDLSGGKISLDDIKKNPKTYVYNVNIDDLNISDTGFKDEVLKWIKRDSAAQKEYTLREYKNILSRSLNYKKIKLPFEIALINYNGQITDCTTDSTRFKAIPFKSGMENTLPVKLNKGQFGKVQLAFPGATFYLLKEMALILSLSLFLIIVCGFSFSYMVALFYRQKKLAEIRNDFMNNMTHELKTPISSVSVALELLQDESVPVNEDVKKEYFEIAGNELKRLTLLVDKVLKMSAFEKMEVKIRRERFTVRPWLEQTVNSLKPLIESHNSDLKISVLPESLEMEADKVHLANVIQNLLDNAIKYYDKHKAVLSVSIDVWEDEKGSYIVVKDNGKGIPEQYLQTIFDKFFRVPTGDEHEIKGYGLGLSYVKEIIRLHDGVIKVQSTLKAGTRFEIIIPKNR